MNLLTKRINRMTEEMKEAGMSRKDISDGWHTFGELYHHRMILTKIIASTYPESAWKSRQHHERRAKRNCRSVPMGRAELS